jgi:hypothetical protein
MKHLGYGFLLIILLFPSCRTDVSGFLDSTILFTEIVPIPSDAPSVTQWGWDPLDSTEFLQAAFDSDYPIIIIPASPGPWITRPLVLPSNKTIVFEPGALLQAKRGEFPGSGDSLLTGNDIQNLTILGNGAEVAMWKTDYQNPPYVPGEWRHAISLRAASNIHIQGLVIRSSGGDGIYLGSHWPADIPYNRNITLQDLHLKDHHRQGISVISVDGLLIQRVLIEGTRGTPPAAGIDFEPNRAVELLSNIQVRQAHIRNNRGPGILVQVQKLDHTSRPIDILLEDVYLRNNVLNTSILGTRGRPRGTITLRNVRRGWFNYRNSRTLDIVIK